MTMASGYHSPSIHSIIKYYEEPEAMTDWQPIETAPRDEMPILLFTTCHGVVEAWYCPSSHTDTSEGREYDGAVWVCADDAFQIEIEETIPPHDGTATHWMPLPPPPEEKT